MNIVLKKVGFLALVAGVTVANVDNNNLRHQRGLQDFDTVKDSLCLACGALETCERLTPNACNTASDSLKDVACDNCDLLDDSGAMCIACEGCDLFDCDTEDIVDIGCGLCPDDGPVSAIPDIGFCFSGVATVQVLQEGAASAGTGATMMKDLKIGDRVLTQDGSYETVYAFGHHHATFKTEFLQIFSDNADRPLEVTQGHLIFLQDKSSPVPAQTIHVGDVLRSSNNNANGSTVTKISTVEREGIYAPMTAGGTVVVDGVVASNYIELNSKQPTPLSDHALIHLTLSPYRMLCNGVSDLFCDTRFYMKNGMPFYAHYGLAILHWLLDANIIVRTVGLSLIFVLTGAFQVMEITFGSSLAPLMMFLGLVAYASSTTGANKGKAKSV